MLITEIKNLDKKKKLIYIDYEPEFALYNSEVRKFQLEQNDEIEPDVLEEIYKLLITRCKTRVSYILAKSDKTSHDLIQSLRKSYYPELIVRKVVDEYVEKGEVNNKIFDYMKKSKDYEALLSKIYSRLRTYIDIKINLWFLKSQHL